jgi:glycosyltransferase involved in cell wall biosynthesis
MKKSCGLFTNIAPLYTRPLWIELNSSAQIDYTFYSSGEGFSGIRSIDKMESLIVSDKGVFDWKFVKNIYAGKILVYQSGIIPFFLKTQHDAYVLFDEMYTISNWLAAIICRIRKKSLLMWGHGLYGDEKFLKKALRLLYFRLSDYHLVYGNRARNLMIENGFAGERIFTVFNSLDYRRHKSLYDSINRCDLDRLRASLFPEHPDLPVVMFIGRLTREKKIFYLLEAVHMSRMKGNFYNCLIIGDGEESLSLRKLSDSLGISDSVCFYGQSYEEDINSRLIMMSECCVSPGNVGLTAIHSLSLGTPVVTHNNVYNQGPEVESVIQGKTGFFFEEDNTVSLSEVIDRIIQYDMKPGMVANCLDQVSRFWNPVKQAAVFEEAILKSILKKNEDRKKD